MLLFFLFFLMRRRFDPPRTVQSAVACVFTTTRTIIVKKRNNYKQYLLAVIFFVYSVPIFGMSPSEGGGGGAAAQRTWDGQTDAIHVAEAGSGASHRILDRAGQAAPDEARIGHVLDDIYGVPPPPLPLAFFLIYTLIYMYYRSNEPQ